MKKIRAYNCIELLEVYSNYVKAYNHVIYNNLLYSVKGYEIDDKIHLGNSESIIYADVKNVRSVCRTDHRITFKHDESGEEAIDWWNTLNTKQKIKINLTSPYKAQDLTNLEIERHYCNYLHSQRKQVDFEQLKSIVKVVEKTLTELQQYNPGIKEWSDYENLKLFMEMMTKSSSFAHKAHKELRSISSKDYVKSYTFRNFPITTASHCITGQSDDRGAMESGILEWCTNGDDAVSMLNKMKKYAQFSNLKIEIIDLDDAKSN